MTYKGYTASLTGVYKMERGEKRHSLEIRNAEDKVVYESAHIYANQKEAFKAAKKIIKQAREKQKHGTEEKTSFEGLICKTPPKLSMWEKINWAKVKKGAHIVNIVTILLQVFLHISQFFFLDVKMENEAVEELMFMMGLLYATFGILFALVTGYWGAIAKGGYTLNRKQQRIWSIVWWINLFLNKGPAIAYDDQPFDKKPGWYSSGPLIELIFEGLFAFFLILGAKGYLFISVVITLTLIVLNYLSTVVWEVAEAGERYDTFPYRRILVPWISLFVIGIGSYILMKLLYG